MNTCRSVTREVLENPIDVRTKDSGINFEEAKRLADQKAREVASNPMLLAWYDRTRGRFSPDVVCCSEHKPGWVVYAESRGGNITVDVNDEAFVFICGAFSGE